MGRGLGLLAALGTIHALSPDFNGGDLVPTQAGLDAQPYIPKKVAFAVLASGTSYPLVVSLVERYQKAMAPFKNVDVMVVLSCSNFSHTPAECQTILSNWTSVITTVPVHLITTDTIGQNFPQLAPIEPEKAQNKPFEWAHHEPTLLSVPDVHKYDYVWVVEQDVTYKGNLTQWAEWVSFTNPMVDFITWNYSIPGGTWSWGQETFNGYRQPRAMHLDVAAIPKGDAQWWVTGYEHLRMWSRSMLQVLTTWLSQGMYVFGEAFSPSLCLHNIFLDCRTNVSWFDPAQLAWHQLPNGVHVAPPAILPSNWSGLADNMWVHGLGPDDAPGWGDLTWAELAPKTKGKPDP